MFKKIVKILFLAALFSLVFVVSASAHSSEVNVNSSSVSFLALPDGTAPDSYSLDYDEDGFSGAMIVPIGIDLIFRSGFEFTVSTTGIYWLSSNFLSECPFYSHISVYDSRDVSTAAYFLGHDNWSTSDHMSVKSVKMFLEAGVTYRLWSAAVDTTTTSDLGDVPFSSQIYMNYSITFDSASENPEAEPVGEAPTDIKGYLQLRNVAEDGTCSFRYFGIRLSNDEKFHNNEDYSAGTLLSSSVTGSADVAMVSFQSYRTSPSTALGASITFPVDIGEVLAPISGSYTFGLKMSGNIFGREDGLVKNFYTVLSNTSASGFTTSAYGTSVAGDGVERTSKWVDSVAFSSGAPLGSGKYKYLAFRFLLSTAGSASAYIFVDVLPLNFGDVTNNYYVNSGNTYNYGGNTYIANNTTINNITYEGDTIINNNGGGDDGEGFNFWKWLADRLGVIFDTVIEVIGDIITKVINAIIDWILDLVDALISFISRTMAWFGNIFTAPGDFFDAISDDSGLWDFFFTEGSGTGGGGSADPGSGGGVQ